MIIQVQNRLQGMSTHSDCEAPQGQMKENCVTQPLLRILTIPHPPADSSLVSLRNDSSSHETVSGIISLEGVTYCPPE